MASALVMAKFYDFDTEDEYFQYIADSFINGQRKQGAELFKQLVDSDRRLCLNWMKDSLSPEQYDSITHAIMVCS